MQIDHLSDVILEPIQSAAAIPNVRERWCLPTMEVNETNVDDDRQLLQMMMAGDESAFVALYRKYQALVYRFSLHTGGLRHIAEEATQETFLALMRAPQQYRSERGPLPLYLLGIARRLVWKSAKRDRLYAPLDEGQELTGLLPDPVNDLARIQQVQRVRHAVLSLPPKYREVIVLCSLQELSYEPKWRSRRAQFAQPRHPNN